MLTMIAVRILELEFGRCGGDVKEQLLTDYYPYCLPWVL